VHPFPTRHPNNKILLRSCLNCRTMSDSQGYDPKRSRVNDDTMMDFIRGTIAGTITEVPGIGPAAAKKMAAGDGDDAITNTYQLIGKFLMLKGKFAAMMQCLHQNVILHPNFIYVMVGWKGPDSDENKVESLEHCEKFWYWLQDQGISAHRSAIVKAIALKVNGLLPGVYDPDLYDDDEEEEWLFMLSSILSHFLDEQFQSLVFGLRKWISQKSVVITTQNFTHIFLANSFSSSFWRIMCLLAENPAFAYKWKGSTHLINWIVEHCPVLSSEIPIFEQHTYLGSSKILRN